MKFKKGDRVRLDLKGSGWDRLLCVIVDIPREGVYHISRLDGGKWDGCGKSDDDTIGIFNDGDFVLVDDTMKKLKEKLLK